MTQPISQQEKRLREDPGLAGPVFMDKFIGWFFFFMPLAGVVYELYRISKQGFIYNPPGILLINYVICTLGCYLVTRANWRGHLAAMTVFLVNCGWLVYAMQALSTSQLTRYMGTFLGLVLIAMSYVAFRLIAIRRGSR